MGNKIEDAIVALLNLRDAMLDAGDADAQEVHNLILKLRDKSQE